MSSSPSEPCSSSLQLVSLRLEPPVSLVLHSNYFSMCCVFLDTPLCFERFVSFFACDAACRFFAICRKSTCSNWMTSWASFVDGLRFHESEDAITDLLEFSFHFRDVFLRVRRLLLVVLLCLLSRQPSILVLLLCDDDFQYPCLSSSVELLSSRHCFPQTLRPASGHCSFCSL